MANSVSDPSRWLMPRSFGGSSSEDLDAFLLDYDMCIVANGYVPVPADPSAEAADFRY